MAVNGDDTGGNDADREAVSAMLGRGSVYTIATVIQLGAGILTIPILTRIVDPEQYGTITAALVVQAVLANLTAFGMPNAISRTFFRRHGPDGRPGTRRRNGACSRRRDRDRRADRPDLVARSSRASTTAPSCGWR